MLEASPTFRDERYPDSAQPDDRALEAKLRGKKVPAIGRVEISIIEESNPRLLAFEKGELDYITVPRADFVPKVMNGDKKPEFADKGVILGRGVQPTVVYTYFNMEDPVVGGYTNEKIALPLRDQHGLQQRGRETQVIRLGQAMPATQPIPPNVVGHDPDFLMGARTTIAGAEGAPRE